MGQVTLIKPFYFVDLDGTLANLKHRLHFISTDRGSHPDWRAFFEACDGDEPIYDVIDTIQALSRVHDIVILSGRSDEVRAKTENWLWRYNIPHKFLLMRKAGDFRPDHIVKSEMIDEFLPRVGATEKDVIACFDDRNQVVEMLRGRNFRVFQVADGDF